MSNDLTTASGVLEWVSETIVGRRAFEPEKFRAKRVAAYTSVAARLALAMRVLKIVERNAAAGAQCDNAECADCYALESCNCILAEANEVDDE